MYSRALSREENAGGRFPTCSLCVQVVMLTDRLEGVPILERRTTDIKEPILAQFIAAVDGDEENT